MEKGIVIMGLRKIFALLFFLLIPIFGADLAVADKAAAPIIVGVVHSEVYPSAGMMKRSFEMAVEAKIG